jgi:hypothetical protein
VVIHIYASGVSILEPLCGILFLSKATTDENNFYLLRIDDFGLIWLSNLLTTSVSDEGYSKGGL